MFSVLTVILIPIVIHIVCTQSESSNGSGNRGLPHDFITRDPFIDYNDFYIDNDTNYKTVDYSLPENQPIIRTEDEEAILDMISAKDKVEEQKSQSESAFGSGGHKAGGSLAGFMIPFTTLVILMLLVILVGVFVVWDLTDNEIEQKIAVIEANLNSDSPQTHRSLSNRRATDAASDGTDASVRSGL